MGTCIEGLTGDVSGLRCQLSDAYTRLNVANCKLEAAKAVFNTPKSSRPSGDVSNGTLVGAQLFGESTGNATPHGVELASHQSPPSHQLPQSSSHQLPMSPTLPQRLVPQTVETLPAAHLSPQLQPTLKHPPLESQPTAPPSRGLSLMGDKEPQSHQVTEVQMAPPARNIAFGHEAMVTVEKKGNKGERLMDVLIRFSNETRFLSEDNLLAVDVPKEWMRNKRMLMNCLELIDYEICRSSSAEDRNHLRRLITNEGGHDSYTVRTAAHALETVCWNKIFAFEGVEQIPTNTPKQKKITGLGVRIRNYRKRIHDATGKVGKAHSTGFMDLTELEVLEKSVEENLAEKKRKSELKQRKASSISRNLLSVYYHTNFFTFRSIPRVM